MAEDTEQMAIDAEESAAIEDMIEDSLETFDDQKELQVQVTEKVEEKRKLSYKEKQHLKKLPKH